MNLRRLPYRNINTIHLEYSWMKCYSSIHALTNLYVTVRNTNIKFANERKGQ